MLEDKLIVRISSAYLKKLEEEAVKLKRKKSELARLIIEEYLDNIDKESKHNNNKQGV